MPRRKRRRKFCPKKEFVSGIRQLFNGLLTFGVLALVGYVGFLFFPFGDPLPPVAQDEVWVHFIDVGQGDSILIHSQNHAVLIDGGPPAARHQVQQFLEARGVSRLDAIVATHPHEDHIGGLPHIIERFPTSAVWMPDATHTTNAFERWLDAIDAAGLGITTARTGDVLRAGPIALTVLAPAHTGHSNLNDYSLVLHKQYGNIAFLFTGDAEVRTESEILAAGLALSADVLQVGHHGSRTSTSEAFLDAVAPQVAVVSVGAGNRFGHPHPLVTDRLEARGTPIYRTDERGSISFVTDGTGFSVSFGG